MKITLEKIIAFIGILGSVYTGGSKLWADKTEVAVMAEKMNNLEKTKEKMQGQIEYIYEAFTEAAKYAKKK